MARLPSGRWLVQQVDDDTVIVFEDVTEEEVVRFNPRDGQDAAQAQKVIHDDVRLSDEDKTFAHFWSGYFYAYATGTR